MSTSGNSKKITLFVFITVISFILTFILAEQVYAIAVGETVEAYGTGSCLNIRSSASTGGSVLACVPDGTQMTVVGGPASANGYTWWNVRVISSGVTGWAVQNYLRTVSAPAPAPTLSMSVNPTSIFLGESVTVSWSSTNATSCIGSRGGSYPTSGSFSHTPPSLPYIYGMTCTGTGGSVTQSVTVSQKTTSPPVVNITSSVSSITLGQSATLGWGTSNATSCTGSASPSDSNWSGSITPVGGGSRTVSPVQTTTYTLSCSGAGGSASRSVTVTVTTPGGGVTLNVPGSNGPLTKMAGDSLTLYWGVANATSWNITSNDPSFSQRNGGAVGATPRYCEGATSPTACATFVPSSPPLGTEQVTWVYTITGFGSNVSDSLEVVVRNQQCRDGRDNDSDGWIDFPADSGCSSSNDNDEFDALVPVPQCRDSADNDSDGKIDFPSDPGCSGTEDNDETDPLPAAPVVNLFRPIIPALNPIINIFEAIVGAPSACTIDANPKLLIMPKNTSTLTWSCDRVINGCTMHDDNPKVPDIGAVASSGSEETPAIDATTEFTLQCPGVPDASVIVRLFDPFLKEIIPQ